MIEIRHSDYFDFIEDGKERICKEYFVYFDNTDLLYKVRKYELIRDRFFPTIEWDNSSNVITTLLENISCNCLRKVFEVLLLDIKAWKDHTQECVK
jgi:hypothetical protein